MQPVPSNVIKGILVFWHQNAQIKTRSAERRERGQSTFSFLLTSEPLLAGVLPRHPTAGAPRRRHRSWPKAGAAAEEAFRYHFQAIWPRKSSEGKNIETLTSKSLHLRVGEGARRVLRPRSSEKTLHSTVGPSFWPSGRLSTERGLGLGQRKSSKESSNVS